MRKIFTLLAAAIVAATMFATEGALPGAFTINENGDQIRFSQGNLQYQASTDTWRFAINQWDTIGADNANISETYSGWIDLFGWGTGGNPTKTTKDDNQYFTFIDWGVNAISNGGNTARQWRTLTYDEWEYVFNKRKNASNLRGKARVNYVAGYVFLADNFTIPSGLSFLPDNETENFYTAEAWSMMESAGAVFLPAAGYRSGTRVWYVGEYSYYWSYDSDIEQIESVRGCMEFLSGRVLTGGYGGRAAGRAVRLVTEVTFSTVTFKDWDGTVLKTEELELGEDATAPADPVREGYTFVGWDAGFTNVQSDMTVTAIYSKPLTGRFSVADDKQVIFAQGNLQYKASDNKWAFSDKQYDMIGSDNAKTSASYNGWIDLFGWGTAANPTETSKESAPYTSFSDWTTNTIENADGKTWYTMPEDEWNYLLSTRAGAADKKGQAVVNDVKGYILLPDKWSLPEGLSFTATPNNYTANVYTASQWEKLEAAGAVFLPAAGFRYGIDINGLPAGNGYYWTPTPSSQYDDMAQALMISEYSKAKVNAAMPCNGYSVRPVTEYAVPKTYTVTFVDWDGTVLKTEEVKEGGTATPPADPARESTAQYDYSFAGWSPGVAAVTGDITYTATYTENVRSYTVRFLNWDGTVLQSSEWEYNSTPVYSGETPVRAEDEENTYAFAGWDKEIAVATAAADYTAQFTATAKAVYFTVTFVDWDGTVLKTEEVKDGGTATPPADPTREGYLFTGWSNAGTIVTSDMTAEAYYKKCSGTCGQNLTWTFDPETGTLTIEGSGDMDNFLYLPWGYPFEVKQVVLPDGLTTIGDEAFWSCDITSVVIPEGVTTIGKRAFENCYHLTSVTIPASVTTIGEYAFYDCSTLETIYNYAVTPQTLGDLVFHGVNQNNCILYVPAIAVEEYMTADQWGDFNHIEPMGVFYTVTFVDWDGDELFVEQVEEGEDAVGPDTDPEREGYTFTGWDQDYKNVTGDMTVKAQYTINQYTVRFLNWDGTVLQSSEWEYNSTPVYSGETPVRAEDEENTYAFAGWDKEIAAATAAADYTAQFTATAKAVYFTVTYYDWDLTILGTEKVEEGHDAQGLNPEPTRDGYIFTGWSKPLTNITSDLSVQAQYEVAKVYFTVTYYDWDLTILGTEKVEEGHDAQGLNPEPTREGYIFAGWSKPLTNITSDLSVQATYKENPGTGIDEVESQKSKVESTKVLRDGVLYIMHNGTMYHVQGQRVK